MLNEEVKSRKESNVRRKQLDISYSHNEGLVRPSFDNEQDMKIQNGGRHTADDTVYFTIKR